MKYWIFNLKSNLTFTEIKKYEESIKEIKEKIIIAPSFIYLNYFIERNYITSAQNVSAYDMGEYTGEVNAKQLKELGASYVIVGHYERRKYFHESKEDIVAKTKHALENDLQVILCIGSYEYDTNSLQEEITNIFNNVNPSEYEKIIIAYEPYDLIGQDSDINVEMVQRNIEFIKGYIKNNYNHDIEIVYGGSVNNDNLLKLQNLPINGFIIGKLTLNVDKIVSTIKSM